MLKPVEKPIKFVKNLETKGKSYPITHVSAVIDDNGESIKSIIDSLKNKGSVTEVTWLELKDKRDTGKLIPGSLYRITDYNCTTTQENTQSAGHQFDIVLLALSENKLAEEGWAMMHDNIYDVTFNDGVTRKCYLYDTDDDYCNLVLVDSLLGCSEIEKQGQLIIDDINKTIITESYSLSDLNEENLPYNYFQNSNLSAWKVWYCLDNDKSRFAWAERDVPTFICNIENALSTLSNAQITRDYDSDSDGKYGYLLVDFESDAVIHVLTDRELKDTGDYTTYFSKNVYTVTHVEVLSSSVTANGRGVIYRLIDEWNNDVAYDFKNIQYIRPCIDNKYDPDNGIDTWVYTFNYVDSSGMIADSSMIYDLDNGYTTNENTILMSDIDLPNIVFFEVTSMNSNIVTSTNCTMLGGAVTLHSCFDCDIATNGIFLHCNGNTFSGDYAIYINNKKVLTES